MSKRLLVAVTNRSSYNKIKPIVRNLPDDIEPSFLLGGGALLYRFSAIEHIVEKDFPDEHIYKIHLAVEGDDLSKMGKTVGLGIIEVSTLLDEIRPDAVLVCADRFETLAVTVAASYKNIPIVHLQGGEHTGTIDDKVRNANTMLSDIHFPATAQAGIRLNHMITSEHIYPYGCPSMDLLIADPNMKIIRDELVLDVKEPDQDAWNEVYHIADRAVNTRGTGSLNVHEPYVIVMLHGDTTDKRFTTHMHELTVALERMETQKIIFWNNIDPGGDKIAKMWRMYKPLDNTKFVRHIEPENFAALLMLSDCIIGNSSTGIREASFLGVHSINVGDRQHGRERGGNVYSVPFRSGAIYDAYIAGRGKSHRPSDLYGGGDAGERIARRISDVLHGR